MLNPIGVKAVNRDDRCIGLTALKAHKQVLPRTIMLVVLALFSQRGRMRLIILFLALTIGGGRAQGATMLVEPAADGRPALVSNCGSVGRCGRATGRRRRGFPPNAPA